MLQDGVLRPNGGVIAWAVPRGIGMSAWGGDDKTRTHVLRRFELVGQTLDGMRVWDVRRAIAATREVLGAPDAPVVLRGAGTTGTVALYASLYEKEIARLDLIGIPPSHREGPQLLNVLKVLDVPRAVAMAAERCEVNIYDADEYTTWLYPLQVRDALGWGDKRVNVERKTDRP
jgi:hypothetical protein